MVFCYSCDWRFQVNCHLLSLPRYCQEHTSKKLIKKLPVVSATRVKGRQHHHCSLGAACKSTKYFWHLTNQILLLRLTLSILGKNFSIFIFFIRIPVTFQANCLCRMNEMQSLFSEKKKKKKKKKNLNVSCYFFSCFFFFFFPPF